VRIADKILRGGHVSDDVLIEAWYSGARSPHLDQCDACAERALEMARWLEQTKQIGIASADAAFTPDRLAVQRSQIMSRLEQLDRPSKLLSFPRASAPAAADLQPRPQHIGAWIAVAAACLVLGVIGGRLSVYEPATPAIQSAKVAPVVEEPKAPAVDQYPGEIDQPQINSLSALENLTQPVMVAKASTRAPRTTAAPGRRR
jgi:hypothetical protein